MKSSCKTSNYLFEADAPRQPTYQQVMELVSDFMQTNNRFKLTKFLRNLFRVQVKAAERELEIGLNKKRNRFVQTYF